MTSKIKNDVQKNNIKITSSLWRYNFFLLSHFIFHNTVTKNFLNESNKFNGFFLPWNRETVNRRDRWMANAVQKSRKTNYEALPVSCPGGKVNFLGSRRAILGENDLDHWIFVQSCLSSKQDYNKPRG